MFLVGSRSTVPHMVSRKGMSKAQTRSSSLFRPDMASLPVHPYSLKGDNSVYWTYYQEFLNGEVRYNSLKRANPGRKALFGKN